MDDFSDDECSDANLTQNEPIDDDFSEENEFSDNEEFSDTDCVENNILLEFEQECAENAPQTSTPNEEQKPERCLSLREQILVEIETIVGKVMTHVHKCDTPTLHTTDSIVGVSLTDRLCRRFAYIVKLIHEIYNLLTTDQYCTKRDIYYRNKSLYGNQGNLNQALTYVCQLLRHSRLELHILSVAKGLVYGDLQFNIQDSTVYCNEQYAHIPSRIDLISSIVCGARFILVVEKEAVFTRLIAERFMQRCPKCILITGKGYPDLCTRQMLKLLVETLAIPALCLVDADPHGLEIYCTYCWGPRVESFESLHMQVPSLVYLGVKRTEIQDLPVSLQQHLTLTDNEITKINKLKSRKEITEQGDIMQQLLMLERSGTKLEMEAVSSLAHNYLAHVYLPNRIQQFFASNHTNSLQFDLLDDI